MATEDPIGKAVGQAVFVGLVALMIEHAKVFDSDPETGLLAARKVVEVAVGDLKLTKSSADGGRSDLSPILGDKMRTVLDDAEKTARHKLGLPLKRPLAH